MIELAKSIRDEIVQVKASLDTCRRDLKRAIGKGEKRWEVERAMRSLNVRLKELNSNLEVCEKMHDTN